MIDLPTGTVTFLFTDIVGSTGLWDKDPDSMHQALVRHDDLVNAGVEQHQGVLVRPRGEGDSFFAVFQQANDAVAASVSIQRSLHAELWETPFPLSVRMAAHTGVADLRMGDYYGAVVNRAARLRGIGHGGQVLLSSATAELVRDDLPSGVALKDMGENRLKDLVRPEHVYQLIIPDLPADFPPPMVDSPRETFATNPLLETKLYLPKWRPSLVSRPRLIERLDQGTEHKLTLVSVPAGFGKTTLLAEWLAATEAGGRRAAWVSLDQSDNDPALFWAYFIAALQTVQSGVGESALSLLHSPKPPPIESVLTTLINEINTIQDPSTGSGHGFVLVLDDYHLIDAKPVHSAITFLLDHLPPQMHLVIASRSDPPLPLARLRGRGESTELRVSDLRFTPDEAAAFLNEAMGLDLSADNVAALETRTEGWIAGLQLAALSMRGREDVSGFIKAFAGDDRYIVDYLVEEVLQRQPERVRSFLLQTSILERLSGPLCDAVTDRKDGKGVLEALERGNLFVVPLDDKRQWYRYHHLFADVLRAHSMEEQPGVLPTLHRRAAAWFEESGMAAEAIEQARAGGDHETVARILSANFEEFDRAGRHMSISSWAASLPETMVRKRPRLALIHAASAMASEDNLQAARKLTSWAEDAINVIEDGGRFDPSDDVDGTVVGLGGLKALKGELLALKLFHSARNLPPEEMARMVGEALELLPPGHHVRGMLQVIGAGIQMEVGDMKSALPDLESRGSDAPRACQRGNGSAGRGPSHI